jgi:hypothetical protein
VVATLGLLEHEAHRTAEVTVGEGGHRVERAKTKQSLRSFAGKTLSIPQKSMHFRMLSALSPSMPVRCVWTSRILSRL